MKFDWNQAAIGLVGGLIVLAIAAAIIAITLSLVMAAGPLWTMAILAIFLVLALAIGGGLWGVG